MVARTVHCLLGRRPSHRFQRNDLNIINFRFELLKALKGPMYAEKVRNAADSDSDDMSDGED